MMDAAPRISVVIPTYNRVVCINDAIDSVLGQSYRNFETIVIDDGSTDGTNGVLEAYGDQIKVIKQVNRGVSAARNAGIKAANGEWIAFLDSDDTWEPEKLRIQINDLEFAPGAIAHMVDASVWERGGGCYSLFDRRKVKNDFKKQSLRNRPLCDVLKSKILTQCCMVKKKIIEKDNYFDTSMKIYEDYDFLTRIALEGTFIANCYPGVNIRRVKEEIQNLGSFSERDPLAAFQIFIGIYNKLKDDSRLNDKEQKTIMRLLADTHRQIAVQYRKQKQLGTAMRFLRQSLAEESGIVSMLRGLYAISGIRGLIRRLNISLH